jgi:flagellar M-ring protein FliF
MDFWNRSWTQIKAYLAGLSYSEKAVALLAAALLLVVFIWLTQYWSRPELTPITQFAGDRQPQAIVKLQNAGIKVTQTGGQLLVPADKLYDAMAVLVQADLMSPDTTVAFDEYIKRQSPLYTNAQSARDFLITKQKVLGQLLARMEGVRHADVQLSIPDDRGFGSAAPKPTASVALEMQGRAAVNKGLVEAVAGLVAGANSPMLPQDVTVVDTNHGRSWTVGSPLDALPSTTLEMLKTLEDHFREKIDSTLSYIDRRIINVTVQIDPTVISKINKTAYEKSEPLLSESNVTSHRSDAGAGSGEPGVRTNVGDDSNASGAGGSSEEKTETHTTYAEKPVVEQSQETRAGNLPKQVSVTVNVPRSYFIKLYHLGQPADAKDPDDAALQKLVPAELLQIEGQVQNLINTDTTKGTVKVYMIPDSGAPQVVATSATGPVAGLTGALDANWAKPVGLGLLALVSLGLMFGMVRKATRQPAMPSVEELAGIPPALPTEDELIGEADETDPSMAGIELNEDELRSRKIAEQIGELVKGNPAEAASLIRRWVRTDQ